MIRSFWKSLTLVGLMACGAQAAGFGDLTGQILYDGDAPTPDALSITKDADFCGKHMLVNEELLVDPETKGVSNVLIFIRSKIAEKDINPEVVKELPEKVRFDNKNCRFEPHVTGVWVGKQILDFHNSDPVGHNSNIAPIGNDGKNTLLPKDGSADYKFRKKTNVPSKVNCNIHPWMTGYVAALDNPYFVVTAVDGKFELKGIPAGKHEFAVWQEKVGWIDTKDWPKGRFEMEIKEGSNDLGEIKLAPKVFEGKKK